MTAQNRRWAKIAADGAIFLGRHSPEKAERTREIQELLRFILREWTAGYGARGFEKSAMAEVPQQSFASNRNRRRCPLP
jgi:hypothetical protein